MNGVFEAIMTSGVLREWMKELEVQAYEYECAVMVRPGSAIFARHSMFYFNEDNLYIKVPNNRTSTIVIRRDRKKQIAYIHVISYGWRRFLERIYDLFTRRYYDIPLADVEYRDGVAVGLEDRRRFAEYHVGGA